MPQPELEHEPTAQPHTAPQARLLQRLHTAKHEQIHTCWHVSARPQPTCAAALLRWFLRPLAGEEAAGGALQHSVTRQHLEDSVNCAIALGSQHECQQALQLYARHLAAPGKH